MLEDRPYLRKPPVPVEPGALHYSLEFLHAVPEDACSDDPASGPTAYPVAVSYQDETFCPGAAVAWAGLFGAAATCASPLSGTRGSVGAESAIPDAPTKPKKAITKIAMNFFMLERL